MAEKKPKKSKKTTNKTTKQKQSQKQSVVVNVNTSSVKRTKNRKTKNTEVSSGRGNYVGRNVGSGVPNNVIVHNNIDTAELVRVLRPEPTAQLQPIQIQEKPRVQEKPPIYRSNSNATLPLNIEPLPHNTPQSITFNSPINTTPFVFEDRATPVAKNTRQQTKKKDIDTDSDEDLVVKKPVGRPRLSEAERRRRQEEKKNKMPIRKRKFN